MRDILATYAVRGLPVWLVFIATLLYGADQPLASLVLSGLAILLATALAVWGRPAPTSAELAATGALICAIAGAYLTGRFATGAHEYAVLAACGALVFAMPRLLQRSEDIDRILSLILVFGAALAFAAFVDFIADPRTQWGALRPYHHGRLSAPFLSANTAATFYGVLVLLGTARFLENLKALRGGTGLAQQTDALLRKLLLPTVVLLTCGTALFLTASRAGVTLSVVAVIGLVIWQGLADWQARGGAGRFRASALFLPALIVLIGTLFALSGSFYASRLDAHGLELDGRAVIFAAYWEAIWLRPLFGDGLGSFRFTSDLIATATNARLLQAQGAAHNLVLQWLLQAGILGTAAAAAVFIGLLESVRRGIAVRRRQRTVLRCLCVIALFVIAHGMVDYAVEIPSVSWLLAVLLGMGRAIVWRQRGR